MDKVINLAILKHPMNWFIIFFMILIFGIALHLVLGFYGVESADGKA